MHAPCSILTLQKFKKNQSPHLDLNSESKFEYNSLSMDSINFVPYISLCLREKHIGKRYCLSCCEVRYGFGMEIHPFLFKVLGEFSFAKIKKKSIVSHTPQW